MTRSRASRCWASSGSTARSAPVAGVLPAAIGANARGEGLICPVGVRAGGRLGEPRDGDHRGRLADPARQPLEGHAGAAAAASRRSARATGAALDLKDIKGQESAKRALEIAAAGGHNLLMVGPPGAGKSMLAARLPSILPPLSPPELLEVSMIASVAGEIEEGALTSARPFRCAASFRQHAGAGRRRTARQARRDFARASRRAVPRRVSRIPAGGARLAAPAARRAATSRSCGRIIASPIRRASCWSPP